MQTSEQLQKSIDILYQKLNHYMDKYSKSLDLVGEIMSITNEAYSVNSEITPIEMANRITDVVGVYVKEVRGK